MLLASTVTMFLRSRSGAPRARRGSAALRLLRRNRDFRLAFVAQLISFAGDWFLFVALAGLVFSLTRSAGLVAALIVAGTVPSALFTFVGGPLADRFNRQVLMVVADLVRGALALGFFLIRDASTVWVAYLLVGGISALEAIFEPAATAAIPNLVDPEDLVTANVLAGSLWGTMLAVGAGLGGLVVAAFGRGAGYVGDSASFLVSAALLIRIHRPFSEPREPHVEHPNLVKATREAVRYARRDHRVLALLSVKAGFGTATGVIGLLPVLAFTVYHAGDRGTGILYAFRGMGALIGPFLARRFIREGDLRTVFRAISVALVTYGAFYALVPWMPGIYAAGAFVLVAHLGGGSQWSLSTYGLQAIVPDHVRGRVFAFDFGLVTATIAVAATLAGLAADHFDPRVVMVGFAAVGVTFAGVWTLATRGVRRSLRPDPVPAARA
ncbi:MAG TPA: MFS transporter [Actinomycetota bacterium]|nr:MFS transporter [Actinomycetota bacterium]